MQTDTEAKASGQKCVPSQVNFIAGLVVALAGMELEYTADM